MSRYEVCQTAAIVCPYCGHEHCDSWEYGAGDDNGETECGECGLPFLWTREVSVTYSTTTIPEPANGPQ